MLHISRDKWTNDSSLFPLDFESEESTVAFLSDTRNESSFGDCYGCSAFSFDSILVIKSIVLGVIVSLTICGNVLVLLAVIISRNLRSSTHYLIVNLAVADLLLGTTVLPFSATLEVSNVWYFGQVFCEVWAAVDVLCCTASIWSLCVISIDRYIGVTRPLAYSTIMTEKRVCVLIGAVWALSISISIGPAFGWKTAPSPDPKVCSVNEELGYVLFSVVGSFYLPGLCIVVVYWKIYNAACKQTKFLESGVKTTRSEVTLRVHKGGTQRRSSTPKSSSPERRVSGIPGKLAKFRRQKKAAKTLGIVVGVFLLCWLPFFFVLPLGKCVIAF
ncbi:UNVERIFIED_CONTAM: hypothetical protein GTU68_031333 [Idotea baltica]|nr:hypothetical protein [Idotea baltica]